MTKSNLNQLKEISINHFNEFGDLFVKFVRRKLEDPIEAAGIDGYSGTITFLHYSEEADHINYLLCQGTKEFDEYIEFLKTLLYMNQL